MNWKPGDRARCLAEWTEKELCDYHYPNGFPKIGTIYLVDRILEADPRGLIFKDLPVSIITNFRESGWHSSVFEKVIPACDRAKTQYGDDEFRS